MSSFAETSHLDRLLRDFSGICNFGKLNYYLGKRAFLEGRDSRYPDIDFCRDPEIICTSEENKELKWIGEKCFRFFSVDECSGNFSFQRVHPLLVS